MPKAEEKKITGAASVVGGATIASRVLGYIRDSAVAFVFGAGLYSDAFFVAFRISNLLRRLLGEGALTSSFIPIFTEEYHQRTREGARALVSSAFTLFFFLLVAISFLGIIFSREIVWLMSPGFASNALKFELTVGLTQLMFPYMITVGLMAIAMGVLNSLRHFAAPAFSPVLFNLAIIFAVFAIAPRLDVPVYALAIGVILGGVLQFGVHFPFLKKFEMAPRMSFDFKDPALKKIILLMGPAALGVGVYQLNIFVTLWFASKLPEGAVSYLYYSGRLMELPLGVFGVAVSTAVLPSLSQFVAQRDWQGFKDSLSFAMRLVNFVTIPATAGLLVLSLPIIEILFKRGEFNSMDASNTAFALYFYAVGLVPVSISRVLSSVFYAMKDTMTPVLVALFTFVVNVVLCFALVGPLKHGGLALATSLSAVVNALALFIILRLRFGRIGARAVTISGIKAIIATAGMTLIIYMLFKALGSQSTSTAVKAAALFLSIGAGVLSYIALARFVKAPEVSFLKGFIRRRG